MATSLPSRTEAIMPQPQEQKLQEVVCSVTLASFASRVAALTSVTSTTAAEGETNAAARSQLQPPTAA
jgi:hypothetical protein